MDFSPTQDEHLKQLWKRTVSPRTETLQRGLEQWSNQPGFMARVALGQIIATDLAVFAYVQLSIRSAGRQASERFRETWAHKALDYLSPTYNERVVESAVQLSTQQAVERLKNQLALSLPSILPGHWWTLITTGFVHLDLRHLIGNLSFLCNFGATVSQVPGLTALHMWAIAIGSSLAGSAATLAHVNWLLDGRGGSPGHALGASGIVNSFTAIALLGAPAQRIHPSSDSIDFSISTRTVFCASLAFDFVRWTAQVWNWHVDLPPRLQQALSDGPGPERVGVCAHLAGAAFGVVYYYIFLAPGVEEEDLSEQDQSWRIEENADEQAGEAAPTRSPLYNIPFYPRNAPISRHNSAM